MGFGHRVYKNYDPRARIIKHIADEVFDMMGKNPLIEYRAGVRTHRPRRRILRQAQALSQRGLLYRPDLPVDGLPGNDVPGTVRDPAHHRMDRAVGRNAARSGAENLAATPGLSRLRSAELCGHGRAEVAQVVFSRAIWDPGACKQQPRKVRRRFTFSAVNRDVPRTESVCIWRQSLAKHCDALRGHT